MADQPPSTDANDTGVQPGVRPPGMPCWVKVLLIIAIILVLAFVIAFFAGVQHGPGLHGAPTGSGAHTSSMEPGAEQG
jgi:hypothetical protein